MSPQTAHDNEVVKHSLAGGLNDAVDNVGVHKRLLLLLFINI